MSGWSENDLTAVLSNLSTLVSDLEIVLLEHRHDTFIFPEDTDETVTFTAGGTNNSFCDWVEIEDNNGIMFSSKFVSSIGHLASILIEGVDVKDKAYLIELAYGSDKTSITSYRFIAGETNKLPAIQQVRIRTEHVPSGEKLYYRMKCETSGKTCTLSFRYHYHN